MRYFLALAAVAGVAACAQPYEGQSLPEIKAACQVNDRPFVEAWGCVRQGFMTRNVDPHPDVKQTYIATGDYIAEQVSAGRMTDTEARMAMAQAEQSAHQTVINRHNASAAASAPVDAAIIGGMMTRNQPYQIQTPPIARPVNCTPIGRTVTCY